MAQAASQPLYQRIFEELHRDITRGHYVPGQKLPSEAALVRRFGASRITVSHALKELQQRNLIDRVAGSGTFVRQTAQQERKGLVFGLIIPDLGETEIFEPICQGIAASPQAEGHALLWPHASAGANSREEQALQLCQQCIKRSVAGVFFAPLELSRHSDEVNRRVLKELRAAAIAVVLLDSRPDAFPSRAQCDLVGIDNHRAGYLATEHLLRLKTERVGFMAYQNQASTVNARIAGYQSALFSQQGTNAQPAIFRVQKQDRLVLPAEAKNYEGFVCANDRLAGQLMHSLLAQNIRIPEDVRIVGIDDVHYASLLPVPLTTVHQPCRDIGETALRVMLHRLGHPKTPTQDVLLDCELVVRESCGAALR